MDDLFGGQIDIDYFEKFWQLYPRKVAKQEARKAWQRRINDERTVATAMSALRVHIKALEWTSPHKQRFIPHPSTWINQERWKDEVRELPPLFTSKAEKAIADAREILHGGDSL